MARHKTGKPAAALLSHNPLADIETLAAQRDEAIKNLSAPPAERVYRFDLGEFLVIQEVMTVWDDLKHRIVQESVLLLEVARLEQVDGAGIQLLCALMKEARTVGARIEWEGHSGALQESAHRMGLAAFLGFEPLRS